MTKNFIFSMGAVTAMALTMTSCGCGTPSPRLSSDLDTVAYAFGVIQGAQYAAVADSNTLVPDDQVDLDEFIAGFLAAVRRQDDKLKMTPDEADSFLREYFQNVQEKMRVKHEAELAEQKANGAEFMADNAAKEGVTVLESGLQIQTIVEGTGKQPKEDNEVLVNYKGTRIDGTVFDENDSITFRLNGVVPGFREGLLNMKEGGKAILTMPSDLAYGDRGAGEDIPGGATLQFEVELLEVK